MSDDGYMLLAVADDFLAQMDNGEPLDPDDVYDWLVAQAHKVGASLLPESGPYCTCGTRDGSHNLSCGINRRARRGREA